MSSKKALGSTAALTLLYIAVLFFLLALFYFPGCSDEEIVSSLTEKTVAGKISGREGVPLGGVMVSINNGEAVMTSTYGTFSIAGVEPPYDLNIFHAPRPFFYQYRGLTTLSPDIELDVYSLDVLENNVILNVSFPDVPGNQNMLFRFITGPDNKVIVEEQSVNSARLRIKWQGGSYINGDLALLQVLKNSEGRIISCERFAARKLWIQNGLHYDTAFSASEMYFNPQEAQMQITAPAGIIFRNFSVKLLFKEFPFSSGFDLINEEFPVSLGFTVPSDLPYPVKISYELEPIDTVNGYDLSAKGFLEPGESYSITIPQPFELLYPSADTTGVNYNTVFSHNHSGKVYEFTIGPYNIITTANLVQMPHTDIYGINIPSNSLQFWNVKQHNASAMDEFVIPRDKSYPTQHRVIIGTPVRLFTAGVMK